MQRIRRPRNGWKMKVFFPFFLYALSRAHQLKNIFKMGDIFTESSYFRSISTASFRIKLSIGKKWSMQRSDKIMVFFFGIYQLAFARKKAKAGDLQQTDDGPSTSKTGSSNSSSCSV